MAMAQPLGFTQRCPIQGFVEKREISDLSGTIVRAEGLSVALLEQQVKHSTFLSLLSDVYSRYPALVTYTSLIAESIFSSESRKLLREAAFGPGLQKIPLSLREKLQGLSSNPDTNLVHFKKSRQTVIH